MATCLVPHCMLAAIKGIHVGSQYILHVYIEVVSINCHNEVGDAHSI